MGKTDEFMGFFVSEEMAKAMQNAMKDSGYTTKTEFLRASLRSFLQKLGFPNPNGMPPYLFDAAR